MSCPATLLRGMLMYLSILLQSPMPESYPVLLEVDEVRFESARPLLKVINFSWVALGPELCSQLVVDLTACLDSEEVGLSLESMQQEVEY